MKNLNAIFIVIGIAIIGATYYIVKKNKSFLKMSEAEKTNFILDTEKKLLDIRNNPNLTQQEKNEKIEVINKKNDEIYSEEEKKAMGIKWVEELQAGNIKLQLTDLDRGMFPKIF